MKLKIHILTTRFKDDIQTGVYYLTVKRYKYFFYKENMINKFITYSR